MYEAFKLVLAKYGHDGRPLNDDSDEEWTKQSDNVSTIIANQYNNKMNVTKQTQAGLFGHMCFSPLLLLYLIPAF